MTVKAPDTTERSERIGRVRDVMTDRAVDVLALAPTDNLLYTLGFSPFPDERASVFFLSLAEGTFLVPAINAEEVRAHVTEFPMFVWTDGSGPTEALAAAIKSLDLRKSPRIGFDPEMRADVVLEIQASTPGAEYMDGASVLRPAREVKTPSELALLRASASAADVAMRDALEACQAGSTELDVAAAAVAGFRRSGVSQISFTIVGSGPNGAHPHHRSSDHILEDGDAVVVDLGGRLDGYSSDITRMAFIGDPSPRYREVHDIVDSALVAARDSVVPGVTCGQIDAAARDVITNAGYGEYFVHRTGHGLGLSMHESPWVIPGSKDVIREGMVFSIEPGIYLPGQFGVRLEEIVGVTADGCETLSDLPRAVFQGTR
jgi:Xaa-Pro aminopeptidase